MAGGNARPIDLSDEEFSKMGSDERASDELERGSIRNSISPPSSLKLDKGKGKERAVNKNEHVKPTEASQPQPESTPSALSLTLIIKFSDGSIHDVPLDIDNVLDVSVSQLRRMIRQNVGGITLNRRLRLIYGGKILNDLTNVATEVAGIELSSIEDTSSSSATSIPAIVKGPKSQRIYIHCAIGDILTAQELAKEGEYDKRIPTRSTLPELRGFDRLRDTGFTDEDIVQLRQQFGRLYGASPVPRTNASDNSQSNTEGVVDNSTQGDNNRNEEEMTRLEEQWIETGVTDGPPDIAALMGGDYLDDLVGILIGMFLGILVVIFINESSALFSKRQQKAIVAGVLVNFSYALLRILM